jgi:hypothetical protein
LTKTDTDALSRHQPFVDFESDGQHITSKIILKARTASDELLLRSFRINGIGLAAAKALLRRLKICFGCCLRSAAVMLAK